MILECNQPLDIHTRTRQCESYTHMAQLNRLGHVISDFYKCISLLMYNV